MEGEKQGKVTFLGKHRRMKTKRGPVYTIMSYRGDLSASRFGRFIPAQGKKSTRRIEDGVAIRCGGNTINPSPAVSRSPVL
jgi:hypothetical protein